MPNLFVMAGPNGAGKTTTSRLILTGARRVEEFVNADIIAAEKGLDDIAAGRLMLQRLDDLTRLRKDIAFETTLSSASMRNRISAMRDVGYVFHLIYVWLPSPEMSIHRVAARVRAGGHNIPEDVIRRRYPRSLENLFNVFIPLADTWVVLDNSHRDRPTRIAERDAGGPLRVYDQGLWDDLRKRYMKPTDTAREETAVLKPSFAMEDVYLAACRAVEEALARHKALGQSVVVWEGGKVVTLEPEQIEA
jgi:predicted ABC-type ATPase